MNTEKTKLTLICDNCIVPLHSASVMTLAKALTMTLTKSG